MERAKRPYSIQKRSTSKKNRNVYYIQFRDPETLKYMTAVSSGKSSKSEAQNWADEQIRTGKVVASDKKGMLLETYAREFWDWDKSSYVKGKLARGRRIGHTHVKKSAGYIEQYIVTSFKGRTLASITLGDIEAWLLGLKDKGALKAKSINRICMAFRTVLKEAYRLDYIPVDPSVRIGMLAEEKLKRGVLSIAEAQELFTETAFKTAWGSDARLFTANPLPPARACARARSAPSRSRTSTRIASTSSRHGSKATALRERSGDRNGERLFPHRSPRCSLR